MDTARRVAYLYRAEVTSASLNVRSIPELLHLAETRLGILHAWREQFNHKMTAEMAKVMSDPKLKQNKTAIAELHRVFEVLKTHLTHETVHKDFSAMAYGRAFSWEVQHKGDEDVWTESEGFFIHHFQEADEVTRKFENWWDGLNKVLKTLVPGNWKALYVSFTDMWLEDDIEKALIHLIAALKAV